MFNPIRLKSRLVGRWSYHEKHGFFQASNRSSRRPRKRLGKKRYLTLSVRQVIPNVQATRRIDRIFVERLPSPAFLRYVGREQNYFAP